MREVDLHRLPRPDNPAESTVAPRVPTWGYCQDISERKSERRFISTSNNLCTERQRRAKTIKDSSWFLRAGRHQRMWLCPASCMTHLYLAEIYEIKRFVEVTGRRSPQADSMVLFGAFCNFLCTRRKKEKRKKNVPK